MGAVPRRRRQRFRQHPNPGGSRVQKSVFIAHKPNVCASQSPRSSAKRVGWQRTRARSGYSCAAAKAKGTVVRTAHVCVGACVCLWHRPMDTCSVQCVAQCRYMHAVADARAAYAFRARTCERARRHSRQRRGVCKRACHALAPAGMNRMVAAHRPRAKTRPPSVHGGHHACRVRTAAPARALSPWWRGVVCSAAAGDGGQRPRTSIAATTTFARCCRCRRNGSCARLSARSGRCARLGRGGAPRPAARRP